MHYMAQEFRNQCLRLSDIQGFGQEDLKAGVTQQLGVGPI